MDVLSQMNAPNSKFKDVYDYPSYEYFRDIHATDDRAEIMLKMAMMEIFEKATNFTMWWTEMHFGKVDDRVVENHEEDCPCKLYNSVFPYFDVNGMYCGAIVVCLVIPTRSRCYVCVRCQYVLPRCSHLRRDK